MSWKLEKTLFSKKIRTEHFFLGIFSFLTLLLVFSLDLNQFAANRFDIFEKGQYWKAALSSFLHADLDHLFHNAFFFTGLSIILSTYFGFWVFPFLSFSAGMLINLCTIALYPPHATLVGVSGVVYFMAAFWLVSFIMIERRQKLSHRFIYAIGMALIFFFPESFKPEVSYLAHSIGFGTGMVFAFAYVSLNLKRIRSHEVWVEKVQPLEIVDFEDNDANVNKLHEIH